MATVGTPNAPAMCIGPVSLVINRSRPAIIDNNSAIVHAVALWRLRTPPARSTDSISRVTVFVAFMWVGMIPWWMVLVFVYRDSLISTMRTVCAYRGEVVAARISGKIKAVIQATAIITVLTARIAADLFPRLLSEKWVAEELAWWLVLAAAVYTFYSLFEYLFANRRIVIAASRVQSEGRAS